jgi:hypothetical protein
LAAVTDGSGTNGIRICVPTSGRKQFLARDPAGSQARRHDAVDRFANFCFPAMRLRYQQCDGAAMARDADDFAALDLVQQLRQMNFRLGSLHFAHHKAFF